MKLYKILRPGRKAPLMGYTYPRVGVWTKPVISPKCYDRGYHVVTADNIVAWLNVGDSVYEVEVRGECSARVDKLSFEQVRLVRRVGRLARYEDLFTRENLHRKRSILRKLVK